MAKTLLFWWLGVSAIVLLHVILTSVFYGREGLKLVIQEGPASNVWLTLLSVALAWILTGATIGLVARGQVSRTQAFRLACFLGLSLLYLNIMRERTLYGDIADYIDAAASLYTGTTIPPRYLYPPLWATLLAPLTPLGRQNIFVICWFGNLLSLCTLFVLLPRTLERYGLSTVLATFATFVFCLVNVPILRSLGYVQVNLHVLNLILGCLLLYPRFPLASAVALGLAVHIKISPIVLVLPFLLVKDLRWLAGFVVSMILVGAVPAALYGWSPYADFARNVSNIYDATPLAFRENSLDSFFRGLMLLSGGSPPGSVYLVWLAKLLFVTAALAIAIVSTRRHPFMKATDAAATVYNAVPVLLVLMVMTSPLVWEHHPILMGLSYLLLPKCLSRPREWVLFGVAYFLAFLVPTFDFYPWSYGRLLSPMIWLYLAWSVSGHGVSELFDRMNRWSRDTLPVAISRLVDDATLKRDGTLEPSCASAIVAEY